MLIVCIYYGYPDNKVHGANIGPMNLVIFVFQEYMAWVAGLDIITIPGIFGAVLHAAIIVYMSSSITSISHLAGYRAFVVLKDDQLKAETTSTGWKITYRTEKCHFEYQLYW